MNRGLRGLEERVLARGQCTLCGACLSLCPYLRSWQGRVVKLHDCDLPEGRCFSYCPRTTVDLDEIHDRLFGGPYEEIEMGPYRSVRMARALDPSWKDKVQNGGVVSALIDLALQEGRIQAALLTRRDPDFLPQGILARRREEVLSCAGSSYVSGPTLEAFNRGPWQGEERIGVVGLPCQILAVARMKMSLLENRTPVDRIGLLIGLFCTWALSHGPFVAFLRERFGARPITRWDISPPPERLLFVWTGGELHRIPLDEIRPSIRPGCLVCFDMTSEFSDISVGTVEGEEGWNTVILRTARGEELLALAEARGLIETRPLHAERVAHLMEASLLKKRRALKAIKEQEDGSGYLTLRPDLIKRLVPEEAA